jgi:hypothetical protein
MPNYVHNYIRITTGDIQAVLHALRTEQSLFDFNKLIPT